jgi:phosphate starvation-inducible PhoH-like protein
MSRQPKSKQSRNQSTSNDEMNRELNRELQEYQNRERPNKKKLTKEEFQNYNIQLTPKQTELYKGIRNNTLTICHGPSGTSKTYTACYTALSLLADGKIDKIILTKPLQTSWEDVGYLKGSLEEKVSPFMKSYFTTFEKIMGKVNFEWFMTIGAIQVETLAFMRGASYDRSLLLIDEVQNCNMSQIMLWVTRLGEGSKAMMMGDVSQYDVKAKDSNFLDFIRLMEGVDNVYNFRFGIEDIVRNKFLIDVVERYEKWKYKN